VGTTTLRRRQITNTAGSPPHAWGQHFAPFFAVFSARFTPTCVGTTTTIMKMPEELEVHPHMRGDNKTLTLFELTPSGSPPHAWGQPHKNAPAVRRFRFTPTCVGTTQAHCPRSGMGQVHPHMRGDNDSYADVSAGEEGSPPHAWGQRQLCGRFCW